MENVCKSGENEWEIENCTNWEKEKEGLVFFYFMKEKEGLGLKR